jgi:hypothetical protein
LALSAATWDSISASLVWICLICSPYGSAFISLFVASFELRRIAAIPANRATIANSNWFGITGFPKSYGNHIRHIIRHIQANIRANWLLKRDVTDSAFEREVSQHPHPLPS